MNRVYGSVAIGLIILPFFIWFCIDLEDFWKIVAVIATGLIAIIYLYFLFANRCPACKKFFSKTVLDETVLDSYPHYKTVRRTDISRDSDGREIGRTERDEQIRVIRHEVLVSCQCKVCGYEWEYMEDRDVEG